MTLRGRSAGSSGPRRGATRVYRQCIRSCNADKKLIAQRGFGKTVSSDDEVDPD